MAIKCILVVLLFAGMVLAVALFGLARYGSIEASVAALREEPLAVDNALKSFGTVNARETVQVEFDLRNLNDRRIELVGCRTSCDCVATSEVPTFIEPYGRKRLHFSITPERANAKYVVEIKMLTDVPTQPEAILSIIGSVVER